MACLWMVTPTLGAQGAGGSETLLPDTTKGFVSIASMQRLNDQWNKTQLGHLMNDPAMKPFRKDLRRQFEEQFSRARDRLGLTLDDLRGISTGEVSAAVMEPAAGQVATAILMDVKGNLDKAKALLATVTANQTKKGAKQSQLEVEGVALLVFDLPPDEKDPRPAQAIYFLRDNLLGAADSMAVVRGVLARASGKPGACLASFVPFQTVMKRCGADAPQWSPQVRWFIQPLGYIEAMRLATPEDQRRKDKTMLDIFKSQGFTAVQGAGGYVDFAVDRYEILHRTAVYAPPPYEKSMKMLVFPNQRDFAPQSWVPRELAAYSTLYSDMLNAFDNFGPMFNALLGDREAGAWADVLEGLRDAPHGPKIDLRSELIAHLGNRVSLMSDYQLPITTTSERLLIAVAAKDDKKVAAAVRKLFKNDKDVRRREFGGHIIWENVPPEKMAVPTISLELPGQKKKGQDEGDQRDKENVLLPNAAVTVAYGHLLIASHYDFLIKVLKNPDPRETLARSLDYQVVTEAIKQLAPEMSAARIFSRTDEEYRVTYELIRQGKMPESETMLARVLNSLSGADKKGVPRKQKIDGREMPDFDVVRRHLGPAGTYVVSEDGGWFIKGFMLSKEMK